jgi:predicted Zn-dependent protease
MKFTPRELKGNINVSKTHPVAELAWLVGGLTCLVLAVCLGLWFITELAVPRVPVDVEVWAGKKMMGKFPYQENPDLTRRLEDLLATLPADSPLRKYDFSVSTVENETVNAMALPGGHIVVYSGLLKQVRSENELAMVLGHELGHYAHRDHLRGMGRGLGTALVLAMIFGQDSLAAEMASNFFKTAEMSYSRQQESAADAFGLQLLAARYGHAGGATDFFSRLAGKVGARFTYLLASHPHPEDRIVELRKMIEARKYKVGKTVPLAWTHLLVNAKKAKSP